MNVNHGPLFEARVRFAKMLVPEPLGEPNNGRVIVASWLDHKVTLAANESRSATGTKSFRVRFAEAKPHSSIRFTINSGYIDA